MANDPHTVGFFAAEVLHRTAQKYPQKTAIIAKEEELTFAALNQRVHAVAGHLQNEGVKQGERVGVLLPNCAAVRSRTCAAKKPTEWVSFAITRMPSEKVCTSATVAPARRARVLTCPVEWRETGRCARETPRPTTLFYR